jgi:hypothetical protein
MTFDEFLRQESGDDAPMVTRIERKPRAASLPREAEEERERETADAEPHFPRIFPGI